MIDTSTKVWSALILPLFQVSWKEVKKYYKNNQVTLEHT